MKKIIDKIPKSLLNNAIIFIILANIILDLDYIIYPFLNSFSLPRPSTIFKFILIPLIMVLMYFKFEKNKRKSLPLIIAYGVTLGVYFVIHSVIAKNAVEPLYLTNNFYFSLSKELFNVLTLVLPIFFVYVVSISDCDENVLERIIKWSSAIISIPIVITNLFVVSFSTYGYSTVDNIFSWFSKAGMVDEPRYYTSKFYFAEGNTIGILLFAILPLLYYFIYKYRNEKKNVLNCILVIFQELAMVMLGTKVATYGSFLVPAMMIAMMIALWIFKKEKFSLKFVLIAMTILLIFAGMYKYTPAYQNQLIDHGSDFDLRHDIDRNSLFLNEGKDEYKKLVGDNMVYKPALIYMFEQYAWIINNTPKDYFMLYYEYKFDPAFWLSYIFDYNFEDRLTGRQTEMIFMNHKWDLVGPKEHIFGVGYTTFMNGSIIIEKDFVQQFMCYGYIGFALVSLPWALIALYLAVKIIIGYKDKWNMLNIACLASVYMMLLSGYLSGHTLDQFITNFMLAVLCGFMLKRVTVTDKKTV